MPLTRAHSDGDELMVPYSKEQLKEAPHHDPGKDLSTEDETALFAYYGVDHGREHDVSGQDTDAAMTRSEEHLRVGTEEVATGRARLRKHVVTEEQQVTVPVSHEELRIEREPVTDENRAEAVHGEDISEAEHEVTLHAERPVVATETEPVERVRMGTETVTEQQEVRGEVRKEQIEVEPDEDARR